MTTIPTEDDIDDNDNQSGRCWGTVVPAVHERSGSPNMRYLLGKLSIVAIYAHTF